MFRTNDDDMYLLATPRLVEVLSGFRYPDGPRDPRPPTVRLHHVGKASHNTPTFRDIAANRELVSAKHFRNTNVLAIFVFDAPPGPDVVTLADVDRATNQSPELISKAVELLSQIRMDGTVMQSASPHPARPAGPLPGLPGGKPLH